MKKLPLVALALVACHHEEPAKSADAKPAVSAEVTVTPIPSAAPTAIPTAGPLPVPAPKPSVKLSTSLAFADTIYPKLDAMAKGQNLFFAPENLREALVMAWMGAKGRTAAQMEGLLRVQGDPAAVAKAEAAEQAALRAGAGKAKLDVAIRVWADKSVKLENVWAGNVNTAFGNGSRGLATELVDFQTGAEPSRLKINSWVATTTNDKIKDLLPAGSIDPLTRVVLTNAVYFKGMWATPFSKAGTSDEAFATATGPVQVPMMHRTGSYQYAEVEGATAVEIPYAGSQLAATFLLPPAGKSLDAWTADSVGVSIHTLVAALSSTQVTVAIPRFTFSWGGSVKKPLQDVGIVDAFSNSADFSGIAQLKNGLQISDVFHKAFVAVDEEGTEAAAATGVVMATRAAILNPPSFRADRPFLFVIRNTATNTVLFVGRVTNPKL